MGNRGSDPEGVGVLTYNPDSPSSVGTKFITFGLVAYYDYFDVNNAQCLAITFGGSYAFVVAYNKYKMGDVSHDPNSGDVPAGGNVAIIKDPLGPHPKRHLVRNSLKAASPGEEEALVVTVRTLVQGSMAGVQVEDTGKGVQPEIRSLLFRQPIPHPDGRMGLGLLLVGYLAEQHGGYARLVWSQPGKGACFALGVPVAQTV